MPKRSLSHTCGDSLTFTSSCMQDNAPARTAWETVEFSDRDTPGFIPPMLLSADTMNIFHQWTR